MGKLYAAGDAEHDSGCGLSWCDVATINHQRRIDCWISFVWSGAGTKSACDLFRHHGHVTDWMQRRECDFDDRRFCRFSIADQCKNYRQHLQHADVFINHQRITVVNSSSNWTQLVDFEIGRAHV